MNRPVDNAAKYAVSFAQSLQASLYLLNVLPPHVIMDDSILASILVTQAELLEKNQRLINQEVESLSKKTNKELKGLVFDGFPSDVICDTANDMKTDLIIMGMKGKGRSNSVFGSTVTSIIRKSRFPVLIIPEMVEYQPVRNLTFASDFDVDVESHCYDLLVQLTKKLNIQVHILNVQRKDLALSAESAIRKMNTSIAFSSLHPVYHSVYDKNVKEGINTFIENNRTHVLAMVAHPHNLFERMHCTVHTKEMSYKTKIPLLILPDK